MANPVIGGAVGSFDQDADWTMVPEHLRDGVQNYVLERRRPGGFLMAVLENDLLGAVTRADPISLARLPDLVRFLWNFAAPGDCQGCKENVEDWLGGRR